VLRGASESLAYMVGPLVSLRGMVLATELRGHGGPRER
jgi:hypothetical protein